MRDRGFWSGYNAGESEGDGNFGFSPEEKTFVSIVLAILGLILFCTALF